DLKIQRHSSRHHSSGWETGYPYNLYGEPNHSTPSWAAQYAVRISDGASLRANHAKDHPTAHRDGVAANQLDPAAQQYKNKVCKVAEKEMSVGILAKLSFLPGINTALQCLHD